MKIATVSAVGLLLLVVGIAVSRSANDSVGGSSSGEEEAGVTVSEREAMPSDRRSGRERSFEEMMKDYPFAADRLEALYLKYPNLRPADVDLADGETLIGEMKRLFEEMGEDLRLPSEMGAQLSGRDEWNEELVKKFLDERKGALEMLLKVCELSTKEATFRYSIFDGSPEILHGLSGSKLLSLALIDAIRSGDEEGAKRYLDALGQIGEAVSRPFLVHSLGGSAMTRQTQRALGRLAEAGFDVSNYVAQATVSRSPEIVLESLRKEVGGVISFLEAGKGRDVGAFAKFVSSTLGVSFSSDGELDSNHQLMREELENMDLDVLQDDYARMASKFLTSLPENFGAAGIDEQVLGDFEFRVSDQGASEGRTLVLESLLDPTFGAVLKQSVQAEQSQREFLTHSAMQQAVAAGVTINRVEDLVPKYLPAVPVNAGTGEAFFYDPGEGAVDFGEK